MKDLDGIFEAANAKKSNDIKVEGIKFADLLADFSFVKPRSEIPITYYASGYLSRRLIKSTECKECHSSFTDEFQPMEYIEVDQESLEEGEKYLNSINRGGLIKPSNVLFVTCMHASDLIEFIRHKPNLLAHLYKSIDARAVFVQAFITKLKGNDQTEAILKSSCSKGHLFKGNIRLIASCMFNMFAKNIIAEQNNKIHTEETPL